MALKVSSAVGYLVEGTGEEDEDVASTADVEVIDGMFDLDDQDHAHYEEKFYGKPHYNFLSRNESNPMAVSVIMEETEVYGMIRSKEGTFRVSQPRDAVQVAWWRRLLGLGPARNEMIGALDPSLPAGEFRQVTNEKLCDALLAYHQKQIIKGFKFGILYAASDQTKEDEMFSNVTSSEEFEEFLTYVGDKIELQGWEKFRGGLDVSNGSTGTHSIYTEHNNNPMMFHVSTMLPFNEADKQRLERKRHIGNDQVVIVYQDGDTVYRPTTVSSRQIHVVILVKSVMIDDQRHYRLAVIRREEVLPFAPPVPEGGLFKAGPEFHDFLMRKLLNAEKACYRAEAIATKLQRTRNALLLDLCQSF